MVFLLLKQLVQYSGAKDGPEDCIISQSACRAKPLYGIYLRIDQSRSGTLRRERLEPEKDQGDLRDPLLIAARASIRTHECGYECAWERDPLGG